MRRSISHWSPGYVSSRIKQAIHQRRHPDDPWLTREAVDFLSQWLHLDDSVLEWGSGRSSIWLAARVGHVFSVEHNPDWLTEVESRAAASGFSDKLSLEFSSLETADTYIGAHPELGKGSIDLCLVDGALRSACALRALELTKAGGVIVIDNVERYLFEKNPTRESPNSRQPGEGNADEKWDRFAEVTRSWRVYWTTDGVSDTAFFFVPESRE
ncbi:MAG: hypothetical protein AAFQ82_13375 [Myxococcota bacterium]